MKRANIERLDRLEVGLNQAVVRLHDVRKSSSPRPSFASLGEVLKWVVCLDGWFWETFGEDYQRIRDGDPDGRMIPALRHARNLAEHSNDLIDLVDVTKGMQYPIRFPICFHELKWKHADEVPAPTKARRKQRLFQSYIRHLEGILVRETVRNANEFFSRAKHRFVSTRPQSQM